MPNLWGGCPLGLPQTVSPFSFTPGVAPEEPCQTCDPPPPPVQLSANAQSGPPPPPGPWRVRAGPGGVRTVACAAVDGRVRLFDMASELPIVGGGRFGFTRLPWFPSLIPRGSWRLETSLLENETSPLLGGQWVGQGPDPRPHT